MGITFPDSHEIDPDTLGISFPAVVDGQRFICLVSSDTLQEIYPVKRLDTADSQFNENKSGFRAVAAEKYVTGTL